MVNQLASLFGPMIAGVFISFIGGFQMLWINVLSFIATLVAVMLLPSMKSTNKNVKIKIHFKMYYLIWLMDLNGSKMTA